MSKPVKTIVAPATFLAGTVKGVGEGVLETVEGVGSIITDTGMQGGKDVYDFWKKEDLNTGVKVVATPFVFVFGTVKGLFKGLGKTAGGVVNTVIKTSTSGIVEVTKSFKEKWQKMPIVSPGDVIGDAINSISESRVAKNIEKVNQLIASGRKNGVDSMRLKIDESLRRIIGIHSKDFNIGMIRESSNHIEIEVVYKTKEKLRK